MPERTLREHLQIEADRMGVEEGWAGWRLLPHGRLSAVVPMLFTFRLIIGSVGADGYDDCWCYHDLAAAIGAMGAWDGEGDPQGWHRHPPSGRRREDGDPATEYVNP